MERRTGSTQAAAVNADEARMRARPWEATGSVAVDVFVHWALVLQKAGHASEGLNQLEAQASGLQWQMKTATAQVEQLAALGRRIDVSGGGRQMAHPAAEAVVAAIATMPAGRRITRYAFDGTPGGWWQPERWLVPMSWKVEREKATVCYFAGKQAAHCPLVQIASLDSIARAREEYRGWWDDLEDLTWTLNKRALGFVVLPPSVVREPWIEALDGAELLVHTADR